MLQYVADLAPESGLAPPAGTMERSRLHQWLNYTASELHKAVYLLFNPAIPVAMKDYARGSVGAKYDLLSAHLADRAYLVGDSFTVADGYLVVTLGWAQPAGVDLSPWPVLTAYRDRILAPRGGTRLVDEAALLSTG